jgi:hypothetical protein
MNFRTRAALAATALLAQPAAAQTWREVSSNADATIYVDVDSIQRTGDRVLYRTRTRYGTPFEAEGDLMDVVSELNEGDCREMSGRALENATSLGDKVVVPPGPVEQTTRHFAVGTVGHKMLNRVCTWSAP